MLGTIYKAVHLTLQSSERAQSIIDSLGLHLSLKGARIQCSRLKGGLPPLDQDTSLFDPPAFVLPHDSNASTISPKAIQPHSNNCTSLVVGKHHDSVIIKNHQDMMRPESLSGQALASRLHSNMKHIPLAFKDSKLSTSMQGMKKTLQEDDIWRITLFIAHTQQTSDTLSNPEKHIRGQQLATMLNTLSDHHFEYKKSFMPSLSATRTTVHGLVSTLYIMSLG